MSFMEINAAVVDRNILQISHDAIMTTMGRC